MSVWVDGCFAFPRPAAALVLELLQVALWEAADFTKVEKVEKKKHWNIFLNLSQSSILSTGFFIAHRHTD